VERWVAVRRGAAFGAAVALTPYLIIKVVWVAGALAGLLPAGEAMSVAAFVALNVVTIAMAAVGITLALVLAKRHATGPARPLIAVSWIGSGLLVPMLPFLIVTSVLGRSGAEESSSMPAWEEALLTVSFLGMGLGLAVAVPLYLRACWPAAFRSPARRGRAAFLAMAGAGLVALPGAYWAAGGTLGLAHPSAADGEWRLLTGNTARWSVAGLCAVAALTSRRPPRWIIGATAWVASGLLFAWNAWKLPLTAYLATGGDGKTVWPENLAIVAAQETVGVVAGLAMFGVVLSASRSAERLRVSEPGESP
jgi:hypothetical protein